MKLPNGIPKDLHRTIRNGGLFGERQKFNGHYEIIGAYTHGDTVVYTVRLHHSPSYSSIVTVVMDALPIKEEKQNDT